MKVKGSSDRRTVLIVSALVLAALAAVVIAMLKNSSGHDDDIGRARIADIRDMVQLCSLEFVREMPVHDSIGTKHIFACRRIEGQIRFDIDSLPVDVGQDTIRVVLPEETVIVRESTLPGSYEIIDVWNTSMFGNRNISNAEENFLKKRHDAGVVRELYGDGTVARAREEAARNLERMLSGLYSRPAIVSIPE